MNENLDFERLIADHIATESEGVAPSGAVEQILTQASQKRPLPRWLALIKEPPMRLSSSLAVGSPTVRFATIMVATLLLALVVAGAGVAGSRLLATDGTHVVDPEGAGDFTTITEAIAMAEDGDIILVRPGTYDESVVVTKDITIRGDGDRDEIIVELSAELGPSVGLDPDPELSTAFLFDDSAATLEHLTVRGDSSRILVSGGAPLLRDLVLDGLGRVCCEEANFEPTGLLIYDESTATIEDNVIQEMGVDFVLGAAPTVSGNDISGGGIWMQGEGVDPLISGNSMNGLSGIAIWGGATPTIEDNTITNMPGSINGVTNMPGSIEIKGAGERIPDTGTDPVIRGNTISGATSAAISVDSGASATIEDNVLLDNGQAISLSADAIVGGNRIEGGGSGILVFGGSPSLVDNVVEGLSGPGIVVGRGTSPSLTGNTSCGNGENLRIVEGATPDIDDTNEICEDPATKG